MQAATLFGKHAGQRVLQLGVVGGEQTQASSRRPRPVHGFDLHAMRRIGQQDRGGLERLCQYILRPPISHDRLEMLEDGRVRVRFTRAWNNGATHHILNPLDLISRLVPLVPPPRIHQVRHHGFLSPRSRIRRLVIPDRSQDGRRVIQLPLFPSNTHPPPHASNLPEKNAEPSTPKLQRICWARLLRRVGGYDMETCPECGGVMRVTKCVLAAEPIRSILEARGGEREQCARPKARAPPEPQMMLPFVGPH